MIISELEKQIEELEQQYNKDFEQSMNSKVPFVLGLKYTMDIIKGLENIGIHCKIAFSPSFGNISPQILIEWMKKEKLLAERGAIFSYQIHKLLKLKEN